MSDWTEFEYEKVFGLYAQEEDFGPLTVIDKPLVDPLRIKLVDEKVSNMTIDWRDQTNTDYTVKENGRRITKNRGSEIITAVKDQTKKRHCSASYAFATVAALESYYLLENVGESALEFSEQQFLDCTNIKRNENPQSYENRGCSGGYIIDSLKYATHDPIFKQRSYPYKGVENRCKNLKAFNGRTGEKEYFQIQGYKRLLADPIEIKKALNSGPVIASMDGHSDSFKNYKSGIID